MLTLCYVSNAVYQRSDISNLDILREARGHNTQHGITGYLVRGPARFAQILEGPKTEVETLYKKISKDRRHFDLKLLTRKENAARLFAEWDMGFSEIGSDAVEDLLAMIRKNAEGELTFLPALDQNASASQGMR